MRSILVHFFRLVLKIYFREVERSGEANVPSTDPVIFVLNHPNALIDPLFILCLAPRKVSFLAKSTLFTIPVISFFVKALDAIPVYRKQDAADVSKNRETFTRSREILEGSGAIAIFPEGTSHSDPKMKPLKTGAARIAISSATNKAVNVVPAGIYYTAKGKFRSKALLIYGKSIQIEPDAKGSDPAPAAVHDLTHKIEEGLKNVTLQAEDHDLLWIVAKAEKIFQADPATLKAAFELQKTVLDRHDDLKKRMSGKISALRNRIERYVSILDRLGIRNPDQLPSAYSWSGVLRFGARNLFILLILSPFALIGTILHYPAYLIIDILAVRISRDSDDVLSTVKVLAALLLYPITWAILFWAFFRFGPQKAAILTLLCAVSAFLAVPFWERVRHFSEAVQVFSLFLFERKHFRTLVTEKSRIQSEMIDLGQS